MFDYFKNLFINKAQIINIDNFIIQNYKLPFDYEKYNYIIVTEDYERYSYLWNKHTLIHIKDVYGNTHPVYIKRDILNLLEQNKGEIILYSINLKGIDKLYSYVKFPNKKYLSKFKLKL